MRFYFLKMDNDQKVVVIGAGPVGSLAALYAASRGNSVEIYELRSGEFRSLLFRIIKLSPTLYPRPASTSVHLGIEVSYSDSQVVHRQHLILMCLMY